MSTFHLVRHGEKAGGRGDPGLSEEGLDEARRTADHLAALPVVAVWTSPLRRARETAAVIAERHGLEPVVDERLRERINWGDDGSEQSWDEFAEIWNRASRDRDWQPPYGDSSRAAGRRFAQAVAEAAAAHGDGDVVFVAHGGIIADVLRNRFDDDQLETMSAGWVDMRTCSVTRIEVDGEHWQLRTLAACDHLDGRP